MKLKAGKDEIVYLLKRVVEKYESTTGQEIVRNTNRKNYEDLAKVLSEISNQLPNTADTLDHDQYPPDPNPKNQEYPYRKYDITGGQIKDAFNGIVANPRPFLVDASYIYLYGIGRRGFDKKPLDTNLIKPSEEVANTQTTFKPEREELKDADLQSLSNTKAAHQSLTRNNATRVLLAALIITLAALAFAITKWKSTQSKWDVIKKDMKLVPYQPTQAEIDSLEGIWLCYTGSPQARSSDDHRYHIVVSNVVDVKYKNGYFTFDRYGASFDHVGYMQFEAPYLVSVHSYVKNNNNSIESPRHSLMQLDQGKKHFSAISASWNFDTGKRNQIIGIREVYIKQGKGGSIQEVINTIENASCRCKIIRWKQGNNKEKVFYLRNESLDSLPDEALRSLLNEKSIILKEPQEGLIIADSTAKGR
jgi:hypothetical protein